MKAHNANAFGDILDWRNPVSLFSEDLGCDRGTAPVTLAAFEGRDDTATEERSQV
jgi:hypothetical protein